MNKYWLQKDGSLQQISYYCIYNFQAHSIHENFNVTGGGGRDGHAEPCWGLRVLVRVELNPGHVVGGNYPPAGRRRRGTVPSYLGRVVHVAVPHHHVVLVAPWRRGSSFHVQSSESDLKKKKKKKKRNKKNIDDPIIEKSLCL